MKIKKENQTYPVKTPRCRTPPPSPPLRVVIDLQLRFVVSVAARRDSWPQECVTGLRGGTGTGASEGVELRLPLPEELKHGTAHGDFSRMLVGLPPGGLYESYLLFDNSMLTGTVQKWDEVDAAQEAAAAAEKLELFPRSAASEDAAGSADDGAAGENAKPDEAEAVNAAADIEGEAATEETGDDTISTAGGTSVPRKAGAATA